ncbi:MAG TPA: TonB-dependent receptor plug domain-containing protein, partial [Vicinamibacterales bacterium]|nr:TonB-dependent receptor plug domain-containing protein [Vicinamibacterales bacterium]
MTRYSLQILTLLLMIAALAGAPQARAAAAPADDPLPVRGRVVRADTLAPVAGARVGDAAAREGHQAVTDEEGLFAFDLPPGRHAIRVRAEGFRPLILDVAVGAAAAAALDLRLQPSVLRHEEHLVVTASRQEQPAAELPRALSVVDLASMDERMPRSAPEALADVPGLLLQKTNHGSGSPYVRGLLGNQVLVLVDGVRLNNSTFRYGPNQYLATIDPASIERIEVLRGSGAVLHGSDAIGGVINLVSRRARLSDGPLRLSGGITGKVMTGGMEQSGRMEAEASSSRAALRGGLSLRNFGDVAAGGSLGVEAPSGYGEVSGDVSGVVRLGRTSLLSASYQHLHQSDVPRFDQVAQRGFSRYAFDPQVRQLLTGTWEWFPTAGPLARLDAAGSWHHTREGRERQARGASVLVTEQDTVETWGATLNAELRRVRGWTMVAGLDAYRDLIGSWRRDIAPADAGAHPTTIIEKRGLYPDGARATSLAAFVTGTWSRGPLRLDLGGRHS